MKPDYPAYQLIDELRRRNCINALLEVPVGEGYEVTIRKVEHDKTLKQLGALFGLWVKEEAERTGESRHYIHRKWKAQFLARIYAVKPMTPEQECWVELLAVYQQGGDRAKFERHAKRISLSWAKLPQMKEYMAAIEEHYQSEGRPLSVPDPEWKAIKQAHDKKREEIQDALKEAA